jgi:hypothetical protein
VSVQAWEEEQGLAPPQQQVGWNVLANAFRTGPEGDSLTKRLTTRKKLSRRRKILSTLMFTLAVFGIICNMIQTEIFLQVWQSTHRLNKALQTGIISFHIAAFKHLNLRFCVGCMCVRSGVCSLI